MKILKTFILIILSLFLLILIPLSILYWSIERTVLNNEFYKEVVVEFDIFENIYTTLEKTIFEQVDEENELLNKGIMYAIDKEWMEKEFLNIVDNLLNYIKGESKEMNLVINIEDRKEMLEEYLIKELEKSEFTSNEFEELKPEVISKEMLNSIEIPDEFNIGENIESEEMNVFVKTFQFVRDIFPIVSYITLGLILILMCLLAGIPGGFKWYGINILISSITIFIALITFKLTLSMSFIDTLIDIPLDTGVIMGLANFILDKFILIPVIYISIGFVFLITGIIWSKKKKKEKSILEDMKVS